MKTSFLFVIFPVLGVCVRLCTGIQWTPASSGQLRERRDTETGNRRGWETLEEWRHLQRNKDKMSRWIICWNINISENLYVHKNTQLVNHLCLWTPVEFYDVQFTNKCSDNQCSHVQLCTLLLCTHVCQTVVPENQWSVQRWQLVMPSRVRKFDAEKRPGSGSNPRIHRIPQFHFVNCILCYYHLIENSYEANWVSYRATIIS